MLHNIQLNFSKSVETQWFGFDFGFTFIYAEQWTQFSRQIVSKMLHWWWNSKLNWLIYNLLFVFFGHTQIFMAFIGFSARMKRSWSLTRSYATAIGELNFIAKLFLGTSPPRSVSAIVPSRMRFIAFAKLQQVNQHNIPAKRTPYTSLSSEHRTPPDGCGHSILLITIDCSATLNSRSGRIWMSGS